MEDLTNKVILIVSPQKWGGVKVSKHHYARELAKKQNKIFFLNPPDSTCKQFSVSDTESPLIKEIDYDGFMKGLNFLPSFFKKAVFSKTFQRLERLIDEKIDIIWSFDNSVLYDFSAFPDCVLKILHIVDFNQHFNMKLSSKTADICLGSTGYIVERFKKYNKNAHFIHHGYVPSHNENVSSDNDQMDEFRLPGINEFKVCYAGNLDIKYIDWRLVEELVDRFKNIDFVFAGPWTDQNRKSIMESKANFFYAGVIPSNQLANFYGLADILIITYKYREFPEQLANPHKMMGYLGTGKMIVSTWSEEYAILHNEGLIVMAPDKEQFIENFKAVIDDYENWSSETLAKVRREYAIDNTLISQVDRIEKLIIS